MMSNFTTYSETTINPLTLREIHEVQLIITIQRLTLEMLARRMFRCAVHSRQKMLNEYLGQEVHMVVVDEASSNEDVWKITDRLTYGITPLNSRES